MAKKIQKRFGHPAISRWELGFYLLLWPTFALIPFYQMYKLSDRIFPELLHEDFSNATLPFISRLKDTTDTEWGFWAAYALPTVCLSIVNSCCFYVASSFSAQNCKRMKITVSVALLVCVLGMRALCAVLLHGTVFYVTLKFHSKMLMWGLALGAIYSFHFHTTQFDFVTGNESSGLLLNYVLMMTYLRLIAFGSECLMRETDQEIDKNNNLFGGDENNHHGTHPYNASSYHRRPPVIPNGNIEDKVDNATPDHHSLFDKKYLRKMKHILLQPLPYSYYDFLQYTLYFPTFFNGPILNFDQFYLSFQTTRYERLKNRKWEIVKDVITTCIYALALEWSYHYLYSASIAQLSHILSTLNCWETVAIVWTQLFMFQVKYIVYYRSAGIFCKIDGFNPPTTPKCITTFYTFTDMWRYFDRGLYLFLQRYIYFPLGGSKAGVVRQIFASFCCFAFIAFWHDPGTNMLAWCLTNWIGIVIESILLVLTRTRHIRSLRERMGAWGWRHTCAAFGILGASATISANMIFLTGFESNLIYLQRLLVWGGSSSISFISFILFVANNISIEVN